MKIKHSRIDVRTALVEGYVEESYWIIKNKFYVTFRYEFKTSNYIVDYLFDLNGTTDKKAIAEQYKKLPLPIVNKIEEAFNQFTENINKKISTDRFREELKKLYSEDIVDTLIIKTLPRIIYKLKNEPLNEIEEIALMQIWNYFKEIILLSVIALTADDNNKTKAISTLMNRLFPMTEKEEEAQIEKLREWEKIFK